MLCHFANGDKFRKCKSNANFKLRLEVSFTHDKELPLCTSHYNDIAGVLDMIEIWYDSESIMNIKNTIPIVEKKVE